MYKKGLRNLEEPYRTIIDRLLHELLGMFNGKLRSLVIYGSVARGDYRKDSDIDILLIIDELPKSRLERTRLFIKVEEKMDRILDELLDKGYKISFSPIIKTPEEAQRLSPLYLDMVEDAIIVYDRNCFFEKILEKLKKKLKELGAERIWIGKKWYWRLKKNYEFGEAIIIE